MLKGYSEKVIMTKARAMFGQNLKPQDYSELVRKSSVADVAAFLKHQTHYSRALSAIEEHTVHRGQLELLLQRDRFHRYIRLLRYTFAREENFYQYLIFRSELDQIIVALRLLNTGSAEPFILSLPSYLIEHASFSLRALAETKSYDEVLKVVEGTRYHAILKRLPPPGPGEPINVQGCETALLTDYYKRVLDLIEKQFSGASREELRRLFILQIDAYNLSSAYRLKRFFKTDSAYIRAHLLPFDSPSTRSIELLLEAQTPQQMAEAIETTRYDLSRVNEDLGLIESMVEWNNYKTSRRSIRFSTSTPVVMVALLMQLDIELQNLTNIIEGIRYSLTQQEISQMLIM